MNPAHSEETIFEHALGLDSPEAREAYLRSACAGDEPMLERLQGLLRAHDRAGRFLDPRPANAEESANAALATLVVVASVPATEKPGDRIGRYKLLEKIGEGGCGVVYMAEQHEPVRRRVALKVIKPGMDSKQVIARFEVERQALALMDHPNIAKVLDAGATETGRPYFVMDLVQGLPVIQFCDEAKLSTRQRLDLFLELCSAVQHAHQKGIIHRDIKPSNILVTLHGDKPVPKVIDFGIAKATHQPLTDKTVFTQFQQFIGTPAYMSPEQATLSGLDIDTRSDIYSLGVLLYELLTGKTPFDAKELLQAGLDEMRRIIREKEPARPSTRVSTLGADELTTTAKRRGLEAPKLVNVLRGELDWIVMKCLEKDRARRYETANGLARDIQRHLNNEPVVACPPSNLYRFQKLVRRNKLAFAAAGTVVSAVIIALGVCCWLLVQEKAAQRKATTEATKSKQVNEFLQDMLKGVGPEVAKGRDAAILKEILDKTSERLGKELTNQPEVEAELRLTAGGVYQAIGDYQPAEAMFRRAVAIQRKLHPRGSEDLAHALANLAAVLTYMETYGEAFQDIGERETAPPTKGRLAEAEHLAREAVAIGEKALGQNDPKVASWLENLGVILEKRSFSREAEEVMRSALAIKAKHPEDAESAKMLGNLTVLLYTRHKITDAENEKQFREVLRLYAKFQGKDSLGVAWALQNIAATSSNAQAAETTAREALTIAGKFLDPGHPSLAEQVHSLARVMVDRENRLDDAERLFNEFLPPTGAPPRSALLPQRRGELFARRGRWKEAVADLTWARDLKPTDHLIWHSLASVLVAQADLNAYREHCQKSVQQFGGDPDVLTAHRIAKDCLILPSPGVDVLTLVRMADRSLLAGTNDPAWPALACTKALAEYRLGHFASAVDWSHAALSSLGAASRVGLRWLTGWLDAQAYAVLAMAQWRLQQTASAQASLAKGLVVFNTWPKTGSVDLGPDWLDRNFDAALLREASEFVTLDPGSLQREKMEWLAKQAQSNDVQTLNKLAWLLATCGDATIRNGTRATGLAERVVAATNRKNAAYLDTLAAAYAEAGDFPKAVSAQKEAIALLGDEKARKDFSSRLKLYESNLPYREP